MCPDEELLSAYVDGEVPSPWKERMERHVAGCPRCARTLEQYRLLDHRLASIENPIEKNSLEAARIRMASSLSGVPAIPGYRQALLRQLQHLWSERVALPMPLLAAGVAMLVFLAGLGFGIITPFGSGAGRIASASVNTGVQTAWIEAMASYMKQNSVQPVMIEMPVESVFDQLGNPVIVSAAPAAFEEVTTTSLGSAYR